MVESSMSNKISCCDTIDQKIKEGLISYDDRYDEYGIIIKSEEGVDFIQKINFCPWSGDRFAASQRDRWFDELEAMGIDPMNDDIPTPYQSAEWRVVSSQE